MSAEDPLRDFGLCLAFVFASGLCSSQPDTTTNRKHKRETRIRFVNIGLWAPPANPSWFAVWAFLFAVWHVAPTREAGPPPREAALSSVDTQAEPNKTRANDVSRGHATDAARNSSAAGMPMSRGPEKPPPPIADRRSVTRRLHAS